jgi:hypothetical protein
LRHLLGPLRRAEKSFGKSTEQCVFVFEL